MSGTIFGIGPLEILVIVILVLLVFGPERLPDLMRQAGRGVRRLREFYVKVAKDLRTELTPFEEEIKVLQEVTNDLRRDLNIIREAADIRTAIPPISLNGATPTAAATTTPAPSSTSTSTSTSTPASTSTSTSTSTPASTPASSAPSPAIAFSTNGIDHDLGEDNPWTQFARAPRADALDKDNPWALG
jgi:sec-independent protein translocase protein TatB